VDSGNINLKIGQIMGGFSTNFFQKLIHIHKMWLKLAKIGKNWQQLTDFQTVFGYFHVFHIDIS
jgi:hypothetical protein